MLSEIIEMNFHGSEWIMNIINKLIGNRTLPTRTVGKTNSFVLVAVRICHKSRNTKALENPSISIY